MRRNVFVMLEPSRLRLALQLAVGAVVVHDLRYRLGPEHGPRSLSDDGHAYLTIVTPVLGLLLALATAHFVWAIAARRPEATAVGGRITVAILAPALLALHVGQEAMEGLLAFGRPVDIGAVLGHGNWIAAPLCLLVASVISWLTRGARRLARAVLERRADQDAAAADPSVSDWPSVSSRPRAPLAHHGAERAPPLLAS